MGNSLQYELRTVLRDRMVMGILLLSLAYFALGQSQLSLGCVFLLATMYGWMGAATMLWIRDASWAHFICLGLLLVWLFGRLPDVLEWVNPHRFGRESAGGWFAMVFWIVIASAAAILRLHRRS